MNDAALVGEGERVGDLPRDRERVADGNRTGRPRKSLCLHQIGERRALDELEHERGAGVGAILKAVDVRDVRMVERGEHLRFAAESRETFGIVGDDAADHFQRDVAAELVIASAIDLAHAPLAEEADHFIRADPAAREKRHGCGTLSRRRYHLSRHSSARCTIEHVGLVLEGTATAAFDDGKVGMLTAGTMFYIPPIPHDSWVVGDARYVSLHFLGAGDYARANSR